MANSKITEEVKRSIVKQYLDVSKVAQQNIYNSSKPANTIQTWKKMLLDWMNISNLKMLFSWLSYAILW